jgi:hypothetical protein
LDVRIIGDECQGKKLEVERIAKKKKSITTPENTDALRVDLENK